MSRYRPRSVRSSLCAAAVLWGCGGDPHAVGGQNPAEIELGTGEVEFESLREAQGVPLIAGAQGGFHVWMSFRAAGFSSSRLELSITTELLNGSGGVVGRRESRIDLEFAALPTGELEFVGWPGVVDVSVCPLGQPIRLTVAALQEQRLVARDERLVSVDEARFRQPPSCQASAAE